MSLHDDVDEAACICIAAACAHVYSFACSGSMTDAALARLEGVCNRLEALESRLGGGGGGAAPAPAGAAPQAPFVKAFDDLLSDFFAPVESGAKACGPDVEKIVAAYKEGLASQRAMLVIAGNNKKPDQAKLQELLKPTAACMEKIEGLKDRRSKQFNHLAMVAEGAACFQWVCIEPTPAPFLADIIPGSEMYANKVIMEFKGKEEQHVEFAKGYKNFLVELQKYVKAHHTTGLSWNPRGGSDYSAAAAAPAAAPKAGGPPPPPPGGGPPPPPPPPPAGFFDDVKKNGAGTLHAARLALSCEVAPCSAMPSSGKEGAGVPNPQAPPTFDSRILTSRATPVRLLDMISSSSVVLALLAAAVKCRPASRMRTSRPSSTLPL